MSYSGVVKSFNPHKGWGFVSANGNDVFLLKKELKGFCVSQGDQLQFNLEQSEKGTHATDVTLLAPAAGFPRFFGEVKSFNSAKGWGFITSEATMAKYGKDMFVSVRDVEVGMLPEGAQCMFKVNESEKGPQAAEVKLLGKAAEAVKGMQGKGGWDMQAMQQQMQQWAGASGWGMGKGQGMGQMQGGWGPAPTNMSKGGTMRMDTKGGGGGMGQMGAPQGGGFGPMGGGGWGAQQQWGPPAQQWGQAAQQWGADAGSGKGKGKGPSENEVFFGILKHGPADKGWGHIASEAMNKLLGKDIFVMKTSLEAAPLSAGEMVAFTVTQGPKGPHAMNLRSVTNHNPEQMYSGTVKSFNETKGWGFAECAQCTQIYGTNIFLHSKELNGQVLQAGEQVHFTVDISTGRGVAKNIQGSSGVTRPAYGGKGTARPGPY